MSSYILVKRGTGYVRVKKSRQPVRSKRKHKPTLGILPFIILAGTITAFIALSGYSIDYSHAQADREGKEIVSSMPALKPLTLAQRRAKAIMEVWQLSENDIAKPVNIFH